MKNKKRANTQGLPVQPKSVDGPGAAPVGPPREHDSFDVIGGRDLEEDYSEVPEPPKMRSPAITPRKFEAPDLGRVLAIPQMGGPATPEEIAAAADEALSYVNKSMANIARANEPAPTYAELSDAIRRGLAMKYREASFLMLEALHALTVMRAEVSVLCEAVTEEERPSVVEVDTAILSAIKQKKEELEADLSRDMHTRIKL